VRHCCNSRKTGATLHKGPACVLLREAWASCMASQVATGVKSCAAQKPCVLICLSWLTASGWWLFDTVSEMLLAVLLSPCRAFVRLLRAREQHLLQGCCSVLGRASSPGLLRVTRAVAVVAAGCSRQPHSAACGMCFGSSAWTDGTRMQVSATWPELQRLSLYRAFRNHCPGSAHALRTPSLAPIGGLRQSSPFLCAS
jgi:hypothetical protein